MAGVLYELRVALGLDTKEYDKQIQDAKKEGSTFGDVLKGSLASAAIQKGISTLTSGIKTVAGGFKDITVAAVSSYKDYEQLTGGVETLFDKSSGKVKKYAQDAYKTSGLSANQYMETVTSFSASLISSLDGDTAKAADVADRAIRDMSDNANKMGTDISSIQTAYQGFAKQNYTMLDNLKLGYGGTKEEAARLVAEASKMDKAMKDLGISVKEDDLSFGNLVNAISVVQQNMKITGTTTKEAMTTIEGSANMAKAAWQNVLTAIAGGGDLKEAMNQLQEAIFGNKKGEGLLNQIIPRLKIVFEGIAEFVAKAAPIIQEKIPKLLDELKPVLKSLMESIATILKTLIPILVPIFLEVGKTFVSGIVEGLGDLGPVGAAIEHALAAIIAVKVITAANNVVKAVSGIGTAFVQVLKYIQPLASNIGTLTGQLINLASAGIGSVMSGLGTVFTFLAAHPIALLIAGIVVIIAGLVVELIKNGDKVKKFLSDFSKFCSGIFEGIGKFVSKHVGELVEGVVGFFKSMYNGAREKLNQFKEFSGNLFEAVRKAASEKVKDMVESVKTFFGNMGTALAEKASDIKTGIEEKFSALRDKASDIWQKIGDFMKSPIDVAKNAISSAINTIKGVFDGLKQFAEGIARVMKSIGEAIVAPIRAAYQVVSSIMNTIKTVFNSIKTIATNIGSAVKSAVSSVGSLGSGVVRHADAMGEGIVFDRLTTFGYAGGKFQQAGEAGQEALIGTKSLSNIIKNAVRNGMNGSGGGVTINVYGAQGQNINDLADAVADRFQTLVDQRAAVWA